MAEPRLEVILAKTRARRWERVIARLMCWGRRRNILQCVEDVGKLPLQTAGERWLERRALARFGKAMDRG